MKVANPPAAIPTKILFASLGNLERAKIHIANIAITDGMIATSLKSAYEIRSKGPKISKLVDAPQRKITIIVNPSSGFLL